MLRKRLAGIALYTFAFTVSTFNIVSAQEPQTSEKLPITAAFELERSNGFLTEPNNNDYEMLRRIGRSINKEMPPERPKTLAATLFDISKLKENKFLQPAKEDDLSQEQKEEAKKLLASYSLDFTELSNNIPQEKERITAKAILETSKIRTIMNEVLNGAESKIQLKEEEKRQILDNVSPILEISDYVTALFSLSNKGLFLRGKLVSETKKFENIDTTPITISDYVNEKALMYFIQNNGKTDVDKLYDNLKLIPQTATIEQALKEVDLDLKKDILENTAEESIISINLEPSGDGSLPDLRIVSPVPNIKALNDILPKLKQLCIQMGIYAEVKKDAKFPIVKLSFFMFKGYAVYAGLLDNFLVVTTGYDNIKEEMDHVAEVKSRQPSELKNPLGRYKRYAKIRTKDFNKQLQRLLASPLLQDKGIPPLPNLNLLDDIEDITFSLEFKPTSSYLNIDMPITKK